MVLGDPWLQTHNPRVDWIGKTWAYTERSNPPEPLSVSAFFDAASKAKCVYAVRYCPKKLDEPQLPPEYEECNRTAVGPVTPHHVYAVRYCPKKSNEPQLPPE